MRLVSWALVFILFLLNDFIKLFCKQEEQEGFSRTVNTCCDVSYPVYCIHSSVWRIGFYIIVYGIILITEIGFLVQFELRHAFPAFEDLYGGLGGLICIRGIIWR